MGLTLDADAHNEAFVPATASSSSLAPQSRPLSENELSYFLPSREYGLNDAFLNLTFRAPRGLITAHRIRVAWAILRVRHPLMAARVDMEPEKYDSARFIYTPPANPEAAVQEAAHFIKLGTRITPEKVSDEYLNGPRLLSIDNPTLLYISTPTEDVSLFSTSQDDIKLAYDDIRDYSVLFGVAHVAMDGLGTHQTNAEFLELLGGSSLTSQAPRSNRELFELLGKEWSVRFGGPRAIQILPPSVEERAPKVDTKAAREDFAKEQARFIGGQAIPRKSSRSRHCTQLDTLFTTHETSHILKACKAQGVTIQNALFAASNLAWMRLVHETSPRGEIIRGKMKAAFGGKLDWPALMYTAVGMRALLPPLDESSSGGVKPSHACLSVGYFNVMLPTNSLPPSVSNPNPDSSVMMQSQARWFWEQARSARRQGEEAIRDPSFLARTVEHGKDRCARAKAFAHLDDARLSAASSTTGPNTHSVPSATKSPTPPTSPTSPPSKASISAPRPPPSAALIGFSLIGNLDPLYAPQRFPSIQVVQSTSGTRKGPGSILVFSHTLAGRLYITIGWDREGFEPGLMEDFSRGLVEIVKEFALGEKARL